MNTTETTAPGCPSEAVFTDGTVPCTLPRGHEEPHAYGDRLVLFDDEAEPTLERVLTIIHNVDEWLDSDVSPGYQEQPLAQDWARVAKVCEEAGEAIDALIGCTGQNPRKGYYGEPDDLLAELADVAVTGMFAIQHFTKNNARTAEVGHGVT